jgi:hypothetical protein
VSNTFCPLCGQGDGVVIHELRFEQIWHQLEQEHGACFTPELIEELTPAATTELLGCRCCGLEYFSPSIAGNVEFYRQLTTTD